MTEVGLDEEGYRVMGLTTQLFAYPQYDYGAEDGLVVGNGLGTQQGNEQPYALFLELISCIVMA